MNANIATDEIHQSLVQIQRKLSNIEDMMKLLITRKEDPETEELITIQEAAELCKLSVTTMYSYSSNGKLNIPVIKQGKKVSFRKADINR